MKSNSAHEPSNRKRQSVPWEEAPAVSRLSYRVEARSVIELYAPER